MNSAEHTFQSGPEHVRQLHAQAERFRLLRDLRHALYPTRSLTRVLAGFLAYLV